MKKAVRDLWINQAAIQELYHRQIDPVCEKYQLNRIEFGIVMFLSKYPESNRAADIVKYKGLSKSYVSLSVKSLSERGILEGHKTETDRKNIYLSLLPAANPIVEEGFKAQKAFCAILYDGFESKEIEQLFAFSNRVTDNVKKANAQYKSTKKNL